MGTDWKIMCPAQTPEKRMTDFFLGMTALVACRARAQNSGGDYVISSWPCRLVQKWNPCAMRRCRPELWTPWAMGIWKLSDYVGGAMTDKGKAWLSGYVFGPFGPLAGPGRIYNFQSRSK